MPELHGQGIASAWIIALVIELKWRREFGESYTVVNDYWGEGTDHMVWLCEVQDFTVN
ncbi:hypothetical protein HUB98_24795 [Paenibacillus barcinonensis]|uniref:Acetyltransferase (GNAT) family protein n=1 Tax=Paenibacillus barcinonensis TaxID=198119 RepID=A0ABX6QA58_PAEBA|nr:hypothetical protein [Paenibacillus barcinonensis]QKS59101.1 hypothetical protein HUB98_24795 [Paenibacillus barcinonensis]